jgi:archaellum biogenesis ATPase FlaH
MSEELHARVAEKLEEVGPSVALALEIKIDNYFDVVRGLIDDFASKKGLITVYVTASVPASTLNGALQALEVNTTGLMFVDCVSHSLMGSIQRTDNTVFVESPTMLENIVLKIEYFSRIAEGRKMLVVIDSINSFAMSNDNKILSEFMVVLMTSLKAKEAYPVVLTIPDQLKPEAKEMLTMVCDLIVPLS